MTETERLQKKIARLEKAIVRHERATIKAERNAHRYMRRWLLADRLQPGIALRVAGYLDAHPDEAKR